MGASVTIAYETDQGARNRFELDIVYAHPTDAQEIESPIARGKFIAAASIENIIADKLAARHRFKGGNTRMKDYDDLWRLSVSKVKVRHSKLVNLLKKTTMSPQLDPEWIAPESETAWKTHRKRYPDLPEKLEILFRDVNKWLSSLRT